jgi:uncharacterized membrane protein YqjE
MAVPGTPDRSGERSTAQLAGDLAHEMTELVHNEIELAKIELAEKGKRAGVGAGLFGTSGVLALLGLGCLTACAVAAMQLAVPVWLAALIVGAAYLLLAGTAALVGRGQVRHATPPVPEQMLESSKEDVAWLKMQARSARR